MCKDFTGREKLKKAKKSQEAIASRDFLYKKRDLVWNTLDEIEIKYNKILEPTYRSFMNVVVFSNAHTVW